MPEEEEGIESDPAEEGMYQKGRDGDHLMGIPFECDLCHYRNIRKESPSDGDSFRVRFMSLQEHPKEGSRFQQPSRRLLVDGDSKSEPGCILGQGF